MPNEVVPALAPHVDVLATITGTTLDLLHFIVGGRPGLLARRTAPSRGRRHHWTLIQARGPSGEETPARGGVGTLPSSARGGVEARLSSSTALLRGGVLTASPSLIGVPAVALAGAGCSSALSATVVTAG
jgi:hypothetical protein